MMGSEKAQAPAIILFANGHHASHRVAGVAAAARIARSYGDQGAIVAVPGGALSALAQADLDRLAPGAHLVDAVGIDAAHAIPAPVLSAAAIVRATGKAGDGPVSRWLNRPISQSISIVLLTLPGVRPIHATFGTAAIALAMFAAMLLGGASGLIAGGLLFHAASVFDGVDGEIARATFRSSAAGAALDSAVDVATNLMFLLGLIFNLTMAGVGQALPVGAWGVALFAIGLTLIAWSGARTGIPFSMELLKQDGRAHLPGPIGSFLVSAVTIVSSRDFFALLFAILILVGRPLLILHIFAAAATIWLPLVILAVSKRSRSSRLERSA